MFVIISEHNLTTYIVFRLCNVHCFMGIHRDNSCLSELISHICTHHFHSVKTQNGIDDI